MPKIQVYNREIPHNSCLVFETIVHRFSSTWHVHRDFEIVYIESGWGHIQYGSGVKAYKAGDLILLGPWIPHEFLEDSLNHHSVSLIFNRDFLVSGFFDSEITKELRDLLDRAIEGMIFHGQDNDYFPFLVRLIKTESGLMQAIHILTLLIQLSVNNRFSIISEHYDYHSDFRKNQLKSEQVLRYINENAFRKLLVDEVAKHFCMSRSTFTRFFNTYVGVSFSKYLTSLRIQKACALLHSTPQPIINIGQDIGFDTTSAFNRAFLQLTGKTPREYRKGGGQAEKAG